MNKYEYTELLYKSNWKPEDALILGETITESLHQNLDGWSSRDKSVIRKYLEDIGLAYKLSGGK